MANGLVVAYASSWLRCALKTIAGPSGTVVVDVVATAAFDVGVIVLGDVNAAGEEAALHQEMVQVVLRVDRQGVLHRAGGSRLSRRRRRR